MKNIWSKINQTIFPQACLLCQANTAQPIGLCDACQAELPWHHDAACPQCALPSLHHHVCGQCLQTPPAFDTTTALLRYQYPIDHVLQTLKYANALHYAHTLGTLLSQKIATQAQAIDLLIPMPLHPMRLRERGFNQSLEIARVVAKQCKLTLAPQYAQRTRHTQPQASLPLAQRTKNIKDAFACTPEVAGMRIALIDDVMTTGASLNALAKAAKKAGAKQVHCWVVARTLAD